VFAKMSKTINKNRESQGMFDLFKELQKKDGADPEELMQ
jgi:hypothetical protein